VALLLHRLATGKVDFYGDSYGTFFGQVLTARFGRLLRSVTLDAAYPVSGKDPFYPQTIRTARRILVPSSRWMRPARRGHRRSGWSATSLRPCLASCPQPPGPVIRQAGQGCGWRRPARLPSATRSGAVLRGRRERLGPARRHVQVHRERQPDQDPAHPVRWTSDTRVSGVVRWNQASGMIQARLAIAGPHRTAASVQLRYSDYVRHSTATLSGHSRGQRIAATMPAP
jgi:pimeloyl-ACP methyl ester carboxylesterase